MRRRNGMIALIMSAAVISAGSYARGEIGTCKPDRFGGITCGSGVGAARIIEDTISPNEQYAFAWRDPAASPDDQPDSYQDMEFLIVRVADGAIFARDKTEYWSTGGGRANRRHENAIWTSDSRMVLRFYDTRFETEALQLYAMPPVGEAALMIDLKKIVQPAVLARMNAKADEWTFSMNGDQKAKVFSSGRLTVPVMMWQPKQGPFDYYSVTLQITKIKTGLTASISRVRKTGEDPKLE